MCTGVFYRLVRNSNMYVLSPCALNVGVCILTPLGILALHLDPTVYVLVMCTTRMIAVGYQSGITSAVQVMLSWLIMTALGGPVVPLV